MSILFQPLYRTKANNELNPRTFDFLRIHEIIIIHFTSCLQHSRPCCIENTITRAARSCLYNSIQHGRSCCKHYLLITKTPTSPPPRKDTLYPPVERQQIF